MEGVFPEDVRFIHLNFSLTNHSEMKKIFVPDKILPLPLPYKFFQKESWFQDKLKLTSISSSYESLSWGEFLANDGRYQIEKKNVLTAVCQAVSSIYQCSN